MKKRIEWIDVAKGMAIITTIIGHTFPFPGRVRRVIFSFHMPLFFILSGLTFRPATNKDEWKRKVANDAKRILLPTYIVFLLCSAYDLFRFLQSNNNIMEFFRGFFERLFWSAGAGRGAIGMLWFCISLFTAKMIINGVYALIKSQQKRILVLTVLSITGYVLGQFHIWLPLNFDVSLTVIFYLMVGMLLQDKITELKMSKKVLLVAILAFAYWSVCIIKGLNVEVSTRYYPYSIISILESLCGSLLFSLLAIVVSKNMYFEKGFAFLGRNSLYIFFAHHMDSYFSFIWARGGYYFSALCRVVVVLILFAIYYFVHSSIKQPKKGIS